MTPVFIEDVKTHVFAGHTLRAACIKAGIPKRRFYYHANSDLLAEIKVATHRSHLKKNKPLRAAIIETWVNNPDLTSKEIAKRFNITVHTVYYAIEQYLPVKKGVNTIVLVLESKV